MALGRAVRGGAQTKVPARKRSKPAALEDRTDLMPELVRFLVRARLAGPLSAVPGPQ